MAWQSGSTCCCWPVSGQDLLDPVEPLCGYVGLPAHWLGNHWQWNGSCWRQCLVMGKMMLPQWNSSISCTGAWCCWGIHECGHNGMVGKQAVQDLADVSELCSSVTKLLQELVYLAPSLADCSSYWPSLVDNTAREHSIGAPVVMVVVVVTNDTVICWVALSWGFIQCSAGTGAALSTAGGLPRADGPS